MDFSGCGVSCIARSSQTFIGLGKLKIVFSLVAYLGLKENGNGISFLCGKNSFDAFEWTEQATWPKPLKVDIPR